MRNRPSSRVLVLSIAVAIALLTIVRKMYTTHAPTISGAAGRAFGPIIQYGPRGKHTATVIMLHGLGDTGNGWAPVAPEMAMDHVKWIFPTAPTRPITVNMGMSMPGWFDIDHLDEASFMKMMKGDHGFDKEGTDESVEYVVRLIEEEIKVTGISPDRVVLGGFSQGGHVALKTMIKQIGMNLGGYMALSTWIEPVKMQLDDATRKTPVFYGHGASDPLIPPMVAQLSAEHLKRNLGFEDLKFTMYPGMQHSTCHQEMQDMKAFLGAVLPAAQPRSEDIDSMSVRELKSFIASRGGNPQMSLEKSELVQQAKSLLQN
jgi:predicted esterase